MSLEPITHEYILSCSPQHAFDVYVNRIGDWWHPDYTANAATLEGVTIEPHVGGRVFASHHDEADDDWGRVTECDRPHLVAHTFTLAQSPDHPSEVRVEFAALDDGCIVRFHHGGWNEGNASYRAKYTEWPLILDRFAALAQAATTG